MPFWAEVRRVIDEWFAEYPHKAEYPHEERARLREAFRSKRPGQNRGAFWELYLHALFIHLGYEVTVHPTLPDTSRRPDFELQRGDKRILVEACVVFSEIVLDEGEVRPPPWLIDAVEHIRNRDFSLAMNEIVTVGTQQPKVREIARALDAWLAELNPDDDLAAGHFPEEPIQFRDWVVRFSAWPRDPEERGTPQRRVLQAEPGEAGGVVDADQLRHSLKGKAGRFGRPTVPLVTALLGAAPFMGRNDMDQALYGSEAVRYYQAHAGYTGPLPPARLVRLPDGFWLRGDGPQNQRVSGVLVAKQLHAASVAEVAPELWLNPWANHPLTECWPFTTFSGDENGAIPVKERQPDMAHLLGLPPGWPDAQPFPAE